MKLALEAIGLEKSSFLYKSISQNKPNSRLNWPLDTKLVDILSQLNDEELTLGYRKTTAYINSCLSLNGTVYNKKKVYRHMKQLGLLQKRYRKKPKQLKSPSVTWYSPLQSNSRWEADLTTLVLKDGSHMYLCAVMDTYDREVIGNFLGFRCRAIDAVQALKMAVSSRFKSDVVPTDITLDIRLDRGSQFTAKEFGDSARQANIHMEFCDIQAPNQKPFIESFFSSFKREVVYRHEFSNPIQIFNAWSQYVLWYNSKRPHSALNFLSPLQFRALPLNAVQGGALFSLISN